GCSLRIRLAGNRCSGGDDGNHSEDVSTQLEVTRDLYLGFRSLPIYALCEDAPGNFLRNGGLRHFFAEGFRRQLPSILRAIQIPSAPAFTRNDNLYKTSGFRGDVSISKWQGAQKTIQHWIIKLAGHDSRLIH